MRIIAVGTLIEFWQRPARGDSEQALRAWVHIVRAADWAKPSDIKLLFNSADILSNDRVVFDIRGNRYRLVAAVHYRGRLVYVRFIGTHTEYDAIDATTI